MKYGGLGIFHCPQKIEDTACEQNPFTDNTLEIGLFKKYDNVPVEYQNNFIGGIT